MISTAQVTLTVDTAKRLIAAAVFQSEAFQEAFSRHRVLFKGSTTVSALTQLAVQTPMRICGRMSENGMKSNKFESDGPHWLLCEKGSARKVDDEVEQIIQTFGGEDLFITGANAIDAFGNAAMLIGSPGGGGYGKVLGAAYTEGFKTLILSTTDKLVPGNLNTLYPQVGRRLCHYSEGMGCGLAPVPGQIITEREAARLLADVEALIFARGGLGVAGGASALQIRGERAEVEKVLTAIDAAHRCDEPLGSEISLTECTFPSEGCKRHLSCKYKRRPSDTHL